MMQVTCLCPTYGRFERLRDAVACFLLQDYPDKRLLILNDAPVSLWTGHSAGGCIHILNQRPQYPTLGHKRQALLEAVRTPLVAHWDDDDLYLPWHLSMLKQRMDDRGVACVKPRAAWWGVGRGVRWSVKGEHPHHNVFEGQMLFRTLDALKLGGYPPLDSGQARALLGKFKHKGLLHTWNPPDDRVSYVYRWADGVSHVSARKGRPNADDDFGDGRPLIPPAADPVEWATAHLQAHPAYRALAGLLIRPVESPVTGG